MTARLSAAERFKGRVKTATKKTWSKERRDSPLCEGERSAPAGGTPPAQRTAPAPSRTTAPPNAHTGQGAGAGIRDALGTGEALHAPAEA